MHIEIEPIGGATSGTNWTRSGNTYTTTGQFANLGIPIAPLTSGKICLEIDVTTSTGPYGIYVGIQPAAPTGGNAHGSNNPDTKAFDLSDLVGTRVTVTIDIDNGTIQRNNETPIALTVSWTELYFGIYDGSSASTGSITLYFKESEFLNPIPAGATAWYEALHPPVPVEFEIGGTATSVANEGDTITAVLTGTSGATVNYTISGVSSADIGGASLTGSVTLTGGTASVNITLTEDMTSGEGPETLTFSFVDAGNTYSADILINDTSSVLYIPSTVDVTEGATFSIILNTSNNPQPNGTVIPYTITGDYITQANIGVPLSGNFVVSNNLASLTLNVGVLPPTTLTISAFGETASSNFTFTSTLTDDVSDISISFDQGYYTTIPIQATMNGIPVIFSDDVWIASGATGNYQTKDVPPPILNGIPMIKTDEQWEASSGLTSYYTKTIPKPDLAEVVAYRNATTSTGGKMNVFTIKALGSEMINEIWY